MTRAEFEEKSFEDVMSQLNEELDEITTLDSLKEFIKEKINEDNFCIASHLCNAIWNDPNPSMSEWYDYNYSMGTLDTPVCLSEKAHVEHLIDDYNGRLISMKYTMDTLKKINGRFNRSHYMTERDVNMANKYVELIENTRSMTEPKIGDIVQYTNEYGDYYGSAHIEKVNEDGTVYICEKPYVPFISINENVGIWCNTSGGAWHNLPTDRLVYVGKREKTFCDWGNCGAWADGAVEFNAEVSVWEYVDENNRFVSENGYKFTTKDFNKCYITFNPSRKNTNYIYFTDGNAWENKMDYQAWLRTFRAEIFKGYWENQFVVWTWKNTEHHVSPTEFENLNLPEDTFMMNGDVLRCKRKYNEDVHTIDTYYVWYWNEPGKDFLESAEEQNKIREEKYTLPYKTPEYQIARRELESGEVKEIEVKNYAGHR